MNTMTNPSAMNNFAHVYSNSIISDSVNWHKISSSFVADSAYNFVIIGNFFQDIQTNTVTVGTAYPDYTYYYIEDVYVSTDSIDNPITTNILENYQMNTCTLYPNPMKEYSILEFDNPQKESSELAIYNIYGKQVKQISCGTNNSIKIERQNLPSGIYFLELHSESKVRLRKKLTIE